MGKPGGQMEIDKWQRLLVGASAVCSASIALSLPCDCPVQLLVDLRQPRLAVFLLAARHTAGAHLIQSSSPCHVAAMHHSITFRPVTYVHCCCTALTEKTTPRYQFWGNSLSDYPNMLCFWCDWRDMSIRRLDLHERLAIFVLACEPDLFYEKFCQRQKPSFNIFLLRVNHKAYKHDLWCIAASWLGLLAVVSSWKLPLSLSHVISCFTNHNNSWAQDSC